MIQSLSLKEFDVFCRQTGCWTWVLSRKSVRLYRRGPGYPKVRIGFHRGGIHQLIWLMVLSSFFLRVISGQSNLEGKLFCVQTTWPADSYLASWWHRRPRICLLQERCAYTWQSGWHYEAVPLNLLPCRTLLQVDTVSKNQRWSWCSKIGDPDVHTGFASLELESKRFHESPVMHP